MAICTISVNSGKKLIQTEEGTALIDALSAQGIFLPSACGSTGHCGLCKINVLEGGQDLTGAEHNLLSDKEIHSFCRLGCQVRAVNNMKIELPVEYLNAQEFSTVVKSKQFLTRDIIELTLQLSDSKTISFHAGQYITLKMPAYDDKKAAMRPFSIASSTSDHTFIQLNIRLNPQGTVTPWIFEKLREGDEIKLTGPRGNFFIRNTLQPILLIAGGSGMAPVRSILKTLRAHKSNRRILFFFGALTQNDLFYMDEMKDLENTLPSFKFVPALSNEPDSSTWNGEKGLITEVIDRVMKDGLSEYEAYLCGKPAMIEGCIPILTKKDILKDRIFFDLFNSPKATK